MAKNNNVRKEEIRIEWKSNYQNAINEINRVKDSLGEQADEVQNLNKVQQDLENKFKQFEKTLNDVNDSVDENSKSNEELTEIVNKLEKSIDNVEKTLTDYKSQLDNTSEANRKLAKSADEANRKLEANKKSSKEVASATKEVASATSATNTEMMDSSVIFSQLDSVTFGLSSKFKDFINQNGGVKAAIIGNREEFKKLTIAQKTATVSANTFKLALKGLMAATIIGGLVVALQHVIENWDVIIDKIRVATDSVYAQHKALIETQVQLKRKLELEELSINRKKREGATDRELLLFQMEAHKKRLEMLKAEKESITILKSETLTWAQELQLFFDNAYSYIYEGIGIGIEGVEKLINGAIGGFESFYNSIKSNKLFVNLGISGGEDMVLKRFDLIGDDIITQMQEQRKNARAEFVEQNKKAFEQSDEYHELILEIERAEESIADFELRIKDMDKASAESARQQREQAESALKAWQEVVRNLNNELAILNADDIFNKKLAEINKSIDDFEKERLDKYAELEKIYKKDSEEYLKSKELIDNVIDKQIKSLNAEKNAIEENQIAFEELSNSIKENDKPRSELIEDIENFLSTIDDSETKSFFAEMFNLDELKATEDFVNEQLRLREEQFQFNDNLSLSENQRELDRITEHNLMVLEAEKTAFEQKKEFLEATYEEQQEMLQQFVDRKEEIEQSHADASAQISQISQEQVIDMIYASLDATSEMNKAMGDNFEIEKGIKVGRSVMNTFEGVTANLNAYAQPVGGIMAGITLAAGLASVMQILKTEPNVSSASSLSAGSVNLDGALTQQPNVQFQQSSESQLAQTIQNQTSEPVKAYVVSKDITSQQQKDAIKRNNSSL